MSHATKPSCQQPQSHSPISETNVISFAIPAVGGVRSFLEEDCLCYEKVEGFGEVGGACGDGNSDLGASGSCLPLMTYLSSLLVTYLSSLPLPTGSGCPPGFIWESQLLLG